MVRCEYAIIMLLYADDIVLFSNSSEELQERLLLSNNCKRWKQKINVPKTKVMVFRRAA